MSFALLSLLFRRIQTYAVTVMYNKARIILRGYYKLQYSQTKSLNINLIDSKFYIASPQGCFFPSFCLTKFPWKVHFQRSAFLALLNCDNLPILALNRDNLSYLFRSKITRNHSNTKRRRNQFNSVESDSLHLPWQIELLFHLENLFNNDTVAILFLIPSNDFFEPTSLGVAPRRADFVFSLKY